MTAVFVTSVNVLDNPTQITNPLQFEIQYECLYDLEDDLEWKLTYVGSAESEKYDQVLDSVFVGPVAPGQYRFVFQADPPDFSKIPSDDIVGVTVILLTCSYKAQEFLRVGYYVNTEYVDEALREDPPEQPQLSALSRNILAGKPRVTKFPITWDATVPEASSSMAAVPAAQPAPPAKLAGFLPAHAGPSEASMDAEMEE
ncbi:ASF1-like histone chaperone [Helicosporidium sp. ATCC 50920]|nr:ASF1-like histone chaperone [Helicosporidium sp. ATCC 50920]|eukprot:KDD75923.1 ASF1-like histone chaperone [Helicosporidium sp. ATCC 50920]